jgi:hypothetical protein
MAHGGASLHSEHRTFVVHGHDCRFKYDLDVLSLFLCRVRHENILVAKDSLDSRALDG